MSPSSNIDKNKFKSSPMSTGYSNSLRQNSPGARSNASQKSSGSKTGSTQQNRLYSPSGRIRNSSGTGSGMYGSNAQTVNRVRREPAVGGGGAVNQSRSNSRTRDDSKINNTTNSSIGRNSSGS